jgi:hypothetical protein
MIRNRNAIACRRRGADHALLSRRFDPAAGSIISFAKNTLAVHLFFAVFR